MPVSNAQGSEPTGLSATRGTHPVGGCRARDAVGRQRRAAGRREQAGDVALVLLHLELGLPLSLRGGRHPLPTVMAGTAARVKICRLGNLRSAISMSNHGQGRPVYMRSRADERL